MVTVSKEERVARAKHASYFAALAKSEEVDPYEEKYGAVNVENVYNTVASAKQRCTNPDAKQYEDYGGRGVEFLFPTVRLATEWILDNLGVRPDGYTLDRIDNNKGYCPGNLRWATRSEQGQNKRLYKRTANGERIRNIMQQRQDLTYETIRTWIIQGKTDEEILQKVKYARPGV